MSLTMYNFLENILATLAIIVPFYFMMPYRIERKKVALLGLLLLASNLCLYPKIGSWVNMIGIPLVLFLIVRCSKTDRIVNFCMMSIGYMMTVLCNYVVIIIFRLCGIDLYAISLIGSIAFQVIYCTLAFAAAYFIGRKIRSHGKELKSYSMLYRKIEKIACAYIGASFVIYEIGILELAKSGNSMDIMIRGAVVMSILFFVALAIPGYVGYAIKGAVEEKENQLQYVSMMFAKAAGLECKTIDREKFLNLKNEMIADFSKKNNNETLKKLLSDTLQGLYEDVYENEE